MPTVDYTPPKSLEPFFVSDEFISLVVGPVGCVSADTEYLTPIGWRRMDSYAEGMTVGQFNPETEQIEFVHPESYYKAQCKWFYHVKTRKGLSQMLSPEHRVLYKKKVGLNKWRVQTAKEMAERHWDDRTDDIRLPVCFKAADRMGLGDMVDDIEQIHTLLNKPFDQVWWFATPEELQRLRGYVIGLYGYRVTDTRFHIRVADKQAADFLQYAFHAAGYIVVIRPSGLNKWIVRGTKCCDRGLGLSTGRGEDKPNNIHVVASPDGMKYCFTVPSGFLVLRHNDRVFVTGNSTKTSAGIIKIAYHAKRMAPCEDGIRRSRCCWIRNTREQLRDTSIPDFLKWFPDGVAGTYSKTDGKFTLRFDDVECEVLFRGLDDKNDVRRLLSLQLSFAVMDEFREIDEEIFKTVQGRLGRYPDKSMVKPRPEWGKDLKGHPIGGCVTDEGLPNAHIWGMTNPPDMDTYWEKFLTNPPKNCHVTIQPDALSDQADWLQYLPANYYTNLCEGKDEDWIDVYVRSKFGKSLAGKPVFRSFSRSLHVSDKPLSANFSSSNPILIGMDVALHPAVTIGQVDPMGRLLVLESISAEGMGVLRFAREKLKPALSQRYAGLQYLVIVDPAANTRSQTDERTAVEVLEAEGFNVITAATNALQPRISAVDSHLTRLIDGRSGILFDPQRCQDLITALMGKYRYRIKKAGDIDDKPEKLHPWSDLADSLQYLCLHADPTGVFSGRSLRNVPEVHRVGWVYA